MARLHPGVYVEEISSGVRPIEGVSTSTAAFIGKAEMGTLNKAVLITSMTEFETKYGTFLSDSSLAQAVLQFFNNGGKSCYVMRIAGGSVSAADITIKDRKSAPAKTLTIKASNEGEWGNKLDVAIRDGTADPENEFAIDVLKDRSDLVPPLPPLPLETHDNLSMNSDADNFVEKVVAAHSKYIVVTVDSANAATAEPGTSRSGRLSVGNAATELGLGTDNGGTEAAGTAGPPATPGTSRSKVSPPTILPADKRKLLIAINGETAQQVTIPDDAATGDAIAAAIQKAVQAFTPSQPANQSAYGAFLCTYETAVDPANPSYLLTFKVGTSFSVAVVAPDSPDTLTSVAAGEKANFIIEIDGDGPHTVTLNGPLANGDAVAAEIQKFVTTLITPKRNANKASFTGFLCSYANTGSTGNPSLLLASGTPAGPARLRSSVRVTNAPAQNVATAWKLGLTNGGLEVTGAAVLRPADSQEPTEYHLGDAVVVVSGNVDGVTFGQGGGTPVANDYKAVLIPTQSPLDVIQDVSILCVPGIGDPDVVASGVNYCTQRADCFFVADCKADDDTVEEAQTFMNGLTVKSSYGAVYFPWLKMGDPTGKSADPILVPPSGFVAGMYARIDAKRGVWKAPAGTEANVGGAVGLATEITDTQQDSLNPIGVNVIRSFPASGLVIWGARTLATRSDPEYRYVPVRRTAIYLEQSIYNGIQWAVFEPNDEDLWASLRLNIGAFMLLQFRAGAFQGRTPNDAFFVKCDSQTTTQADIDTGTVNILVGFAPLKPAEFVVLKLSQKAGQPAA